MADSVKQSAKYIATLFAFIAVAFVLSWCSVYSFWIGGYLLRSVRVVRIGDAVGQVILFPARTLFQFTGGMVDQFTLLTSPLLYATYNAALLGILAYACCRRWIFADGKRHSR